MAKFSFTLDSFKITDTRSLHKDTDYVSFTLKVGSGPPQTKVKSMGDVNNGTHQVGLTFSEILVNATDSVTVNYLIVNAGSASRVNVETALEKAGGALANGAFGPLPQPGSALQALAAWLNTELKSVFKAGSCDGAVAAECGIFPYNALIQNTDKIPFSEQTPHLGTKAPSGCLGRNSSYVVNWFMIEDSIVPPVTQMTFSDAQNQLQMARLSAQHVGPGFWVTKQDPKPKQVVSVNSVVTLTTMVQP
jgi:hypothetical protein